MKAKAAYWAAVFTAALTTHSAAFAACCEPSKAGAQVEYITGGIGDDEEKSMQSKQSDYSLWIVTAEKSTGAWMSNVHARITPLKSKKESGAPILDTELNGPWLMVKLPPGDYKIDISHGEDTQHATVSLPPGAHRKMIFRFAGTS